MMRKLSRVLVILLVVALMVPVMSMAAMAEGGEIVLNIPHYKAGENVGAKLFLPQVERFNEKYAGKYKVVIEELVQSMYSEKMKQLAQQNKLPALIEGGDTDWLQTVVLPNKLYMDLKPWLEANPEYMDRFIPETLGYNTMEDGAIFSYTYPVLRPIGLYYNATMVSPEKPTGDMTWEEFEAMVGDNKIAFMTGENAWTSALFHAAIMASEEGGPEYMRARIQDKEKDFNQPIWVNSTAKLQAMLQKYASSNTVGAVYADAANTFMSGNAAVIANGSWMVGDFGAESTDKWSGTFNGDQVSGGVFPGNVAMGNAYGYGWWIPATATEDEQEAALAFLEFIMSPEELEMYMLLEGGVAPRMETSEKFKEESAQNALLYEYVNAFGAESTLVPTIGDMVPYSIGDIEYGKLMPKLIDGSLTPEQFCQELTKKAAETALD